MEALENIKTALSEEEDLFQHDYPWTFSDADMIKVC